MKPHPLLALTPMEMDEPEGRGEDDVRRFTRLQAEYELIAQATRRRLLGTSLAWTDDDKAAARRLQLACSDLATLGQRLGESLVRASGVNDPRARLVVARTLLFMGEAMKWEAVVAPEARRDYRRSHALMMVVMAGGMHRDAMQIQVDGRPRNCTLESLYFRMLLLARFGGGALNPKQLEILDAWMWLWMPVLSGVAEAPAGSALRVDLDSDRGLQRGPRAGKGPSLYLPQAPIEKAYLALLAEFQAGRIVPADGIAATFRIEEHIAVLALMRRGLRASRGPVVVRAPRRTLEDSVELLVGLGEISGQTPSKFDINRRMVQLADESATGIGFEGAIETCGALAAGDLVALRLAPDEPMVPCKVVRCIPSRAPGRMLVGVLRLGASMRSVEASTGVESEQLLFVAGADRGGRQDAYLLSERSFAEGQAFTAEMAAKRFKFRPNRARDRGRGWVLAGFEVMEARPVALAA